MNRCQYFFFFNDTATTEIYTLSLHDALPICRRTLHFTREVETAIYNTLPHNLASLLHHHPLRCPAAFIGGRASAEMRQGGMDPTRRITRGRVVMLDGSHPFPLERPHPTAAPLAAPLLHMQN